MSKRGFTIVELLIVIVVIGVLAAITIVAYNGIQQRAQTSTLKSDLTNASKQMEVANVDSGSYPTTFPSVVKASPNVVLSLSQASSGYCINAESTTNSSLRWSYNSSSGGLQEGVCSGAVISGSESGIKPNIVTNTDFSSGWQLNFQNGSGRSLTTRAGITGDPYPNRPVLVLNNSLTGSTTWSLIQTASINHSAIISGRNYSKSLWVRGTGTGFSSGIGIFSVNNGGGINGSIPGGGGGTITSSWQKFTQSATATQNAPSDNVLYQPVSTSIFTTTGWTLEFQGFELREQ